MPVVAFCVAALLTIMPSSSPPPALQILEAVTKFAVVRMAITGEAMFTSCRTTADLLARNLLDSVGVWWFPGMILQVTAFLLSGLWGGAVFGVSYAYWGRSQVALSSGIMLGVVSFLFGLLTISYLNSVLLSIVDAVYIVSMGVMFWGCQAWGGAAAGYLHAVPLQLQYHHHLHPLCLALQCTSNSRSCLCCNFLACIFSLFLTQSHVLHCNSLPAVLCDGQGPTRDDPS